MALALMIEMKRKVKETNRGREDEPSRFEYTSNPGGDMSPENTITVCFVTLTVTDITIFPSGERWGRIPFVTTPRLYPGTVCSQVV